MEIKESSRARKMHNLIKVILLYGIVWAIEGQVIISSMFVRFACTINVFLLFIYLFIYLFIFIYLFLFFLTLWIILLL